MWISDGAESAGNSRQQFATVTKRIVRVFLIHKNTRVIRFVTVADCYKTEKYDQNQCEMDSECRYIDQFSTIS